MKVKLSLVISAFLMVIGAMLIGVWAASNVSLQMSGHVSFEANSVYARVKGQVEGSQNDPIIQDALFTADDENSPSEAVLASWNNDFSFNETADDITFTITVENLVNRPLTVGVLDEGSITSNCQLSVTVDGQDYIFGTSHKIEGSPSETNPNKAVFVITMSVLNKHMEASLDYKFKIQLDNGELEYKPQLLRYGLYGNNFDIYGVDPDPSKIDTIPYVANDLQLPTTFDVVAPTEENINETVDSVSYEDLGDMDETSISPNYYTANYLLQAQEIAAITSGTSLSTYYVNALNLTNISDQNFTLVFNLMCGIYGSVIMPYRQLWAAYTIGILQLYLNSDVDPTETLNRIGLDSIPQPYSQEEKDAFVYLVSLPQEKIDEINDSSNSSGDNDNSISPTPENPLIIKFFYLVPGTTYNLSDYISNVYINGNIDTDTINISGDYNFNIDGIAGLNTENYFVSSSNSKYSSVDGVLFNKNQNTLIAYPSAKALSEYRVPNIVIDINDSAFLNSNDLQTIVINYDQRDNVFALVDSPSITRIESENYITRFEIADWESSKIEVEIVYIDNGSGLKYIQGEGGYLVSGYTNETESIIIPSSYQPSGGSSQDVVGVVSNAFSGNTTLTSISIPSTITTIQDQAFNNIPNLTELDFGNAVLTSYGQNVFGGRTDIVIFTQNENTKNLIKEETPNSTSTQISISIETELGTEEGSTTEAPHKGTFNLIFTLDGKEFKIDTYYDCTLSNLYNGYMIIQSTQAGDINTSVSVQIESETYGTTDIVDHIQEQIAIAKIEEDGSLTKIAGTADDVTYFNHPGGSADVNYEGTTQAGEELALVVKLAVMTNVQCFTEGTLVTLADGSTKPIEDITYDDLLLVYDFDRGEFSYSYPIWITSGQYINYYKMTFDDGSEVEIVLAHRLFDVDGLTYETSIDATYSQIGDRFFRQTLDENGSPMITTPTCISIEKIDEQCTYYNLVTSQSFNFFANGFLGATGAANIYTFEKTEDGRYIHNQEQLQNTKYENNTFTYEDFNSEIIPYEFFLAYRLAETKNMVNILANIPPYNQYPLEVVYQMAISVAEAYFEHGYFENMYAWPEQFQVTTSAGLLTKVSPRDTFSLPSPEDEVGFTGWYNTLDGRIYQPGEEMTVYMNTHLIARYN